MSAIICQDVWFRYHARTPWVIQSFAHEFRPGITLIKGASGCGKSTLLRMIAGYLEPERGSILTPAGQSPASKDYQRRDVGYVFQQLNLLPLATVERNLEMAGSLAGLPMEETGRRAAIWLKTLGLEEFGKRRPMSLSGGQQQRAAIARALVKEPQVLLLDEPTSGLDDLNTQVISRALENFVSGPRICVICSHDARLDLIADEVLDFNCFLPLEGHLIALAGAA